MAKRKVSKKAVKKLKEHGESSDSPLPSNPEGLTFTELELEPLVKFLNRVVHEAKFNFSMKEYEEFKKNYTECIQHIKKCENYIFEMKNFYDGKS